LSLNLLAASKTGYCDEGYSKVYTHSIYDARFVNDFNFKNLTLFT